MSEHRFVPGVVYDITLEVDGAQVELTARLAGVVMDPNGGPRLLLEPVPGAEIRLWTEAGENLVVSQKEPSAS